MQVPDLLEQVFEYLFDDRIQNEINEKRPEQGGIFIKACNRAQFPMKCLSKTFLPSKEVMKMNRCYINPGTVLVAATLVMLAITKILTWGENGEPSDESIVAKAGFDSPEKAFEVYADAMDKMDVRRTLACLTDPSSDWVAGQAVLVELRRLKRTSEDADKEEQKRYAKFSSGTVSTSNCSKTHCPNLPALMNAWLSESKKQVRC